MAKDTRRVSGELADLIVNGMIAESALFKERETAKQELYLLADKVYFAMIGKHLKAVESVPEGYFMTSDSFALSNRTPDGLVTAQDFAMSRPRRIPERCKNYYNGFDIKELSSECREAIEAHKNVDLRCRSLFGEIETLRAKTRSALTSFRTVGQLVEAWPESASFVPAPEEKSNAIAIAIPELNGLLGLKRAA